MPIFFDKPQKKDIITCDNINQVLLIQQFTFELPYYHDFGWYYSSENYRGLKLGSRVENKIRASVI